MSEKDFETQEAIQEQSPTAARFENNDLSFDELSTMIGSTFVDNNYSISSTKNLLPRHIE